MRSSPLPRWSDRGEQAMRRAMQAVGSTGPLTPAHLLVGASEVAGPVADALRDRSAGAPGLREVLGLSAASSGAGCRAVDRPSGGVGVCLGTPARRARRPGTPDRWLVDQGDDGVRDALARARSGPAELRRVALRALGAPSDLAPIPLVPLQHWPAGTGSSPPLGLAHRATRVTPRIDAGFVTGPVPWHLRHPVLAGWGCWFGNRRVDARAAWLRLGPTSTERFAGGVLPTGEAARRVPGGGSLRNTARGGATGSAIVCDMTALHVRNLPESVVTALRERAARHGQSMQQEIRQILETAAKLSPPRQAPEPVHLTTVRTAGTSTWNREEIYGDTGR